MIKFREEDDEKIAKATDALEKAREQNGLSPHDDIALFFFEAVIWIYNLNAPKEHQLLIFEEMVKNARDHLKDMQGRSPNWEDEAITH